MEGRNISDLSPNISDNAGRLRDVDGIITELESLDTPTEAMSDRNLILLGRMEMLHNIIAYLKVI